MAARLRLVPVRVQLRRASNTTDIDRSVETLPASVQEAEAIVPPKWPRKPQLSLAALTISILVCIIGIAGPYHVSSILIRISFE